MSGLALIMKELGFNVQGSDISNNKNIERLNKSGIKVCIGHNQKNLKKATLVVMSSAIKKNNPELLAAKKKSIPILSRADMLAELMRNKHSIAVAGSHGKTTTTSIVGSVLHSCKKDPTIVNGGIINAFSSIDNPLQSGVAHCPTDKIFPLLFILANLRCAPPISHPIKLDIFIFLLKF